ncbi:fam-j protein, partial [Plasmodium relictum]
DYSTIQTEKESYRISLMGTKNVEHEDLVELQNILDEILNTSPDSREKSIDLSLEQDYSTIQTEKESYRISLMGTKNVEHEDLVELQNILDEILNTSPDSREESIDLSLEQDYSTIQTEKESYRISLMGTKNVEHEDLVELQNILDEILNTSPDSRTESIDLSLEQDYSTIHTEKESSRINLMGKKNVEHEDSYNLSNTFSDSQVTPNYLEKGFLELPLGDQSSTIKNAGIPSSTSNLMLTENKEHEKFVELETIPFNPPIEQQNLIFYIEERSSSTNKLMHIANEESTELENIFPSFSINQPSTTINNNEEDPSLVNTIKQTSEEYIGDGKIDEKICGENEFNKQIFFNDLSVNDYSTDVNSGDAQSYKRSGKKRNYEDIDDSDDQDIGDRIYISPRKKYTYNKNGENMVCSVSNIFKMEINCLSRDVVPNLEKLRDILKNEYKDTYNDLKKKLNIIILSLRDIITEEIQKINNSDLKVIKNYYDQNIEGIKLVKKINNSILSFRYTVNHEFNRIEEIFERIKHFLKILHDLNDEYKFLQDICYFKSLIIDNSMHNKLFSPSFILSFETLKRIFELLKFMDKLIECIEESLKNGFILGDRVYFCIVQRIITLLNVQINTVIRNNLAKLGEFLNLLNLSYEDYGIIIQTIFFFFKKENLKTREKLKQYLNKPYKKNSLKAIYDFLLEEEKCILWYYNEASKIFNLNLYDKNENGISFNDLINKESAANNLFSLYETLVKLIGASFIKKQLFIIMKIRKSLLNMNSLKKRKGVSYETKEILTEELQLKLLSQIETEKCKMEKVKLNMVNLRLFASVKYDMKNIQASNDLKNKIKEIISVLNFVHNIIYKNKERNNFNHEEMDNTENILLALYYANQRFIKLTEKEK